MTTRQRGSVYRVKGGYGIRWREPDGSWGKQGRPPFPTKTAARDWYDTTVLPRLRGEAPPEPEGAPVTLQAFVDVYLAAHGPDVAPRTLTTLRTRLATACKRFGDVPLDELEGMAPEIAAWRSGLGPTARFAYTAALRQCLGAAVRWGCIRTNPAVLAGPNPQPQPPEIGPLTLGEVDGLAAELGDSYGPLVLFAAETGLRPGEWIALERRDVDRDAGAVRVERAYSAGEVRPTTKTKRWRRVPLSSRALTALDAAPRRIDTPVLFPAAKGGPIEPDGWRTREWYPALDAAGIARCGP